jgi:hypothetical protein
MGNSESEQRKLTVAVYRFITVKELRARFKALPPTTPQKLKEQLDKAPACSNVSIIPVTVGASLSSPSKNYRKGFHGELSLLVGEIRPRSDLDKLFDDSRVGMSLSQYQFFFG